MSNLAPQIFLTVVDPARQIRPDHVKAFLATIGDGTYLTLATWRARETSHIFIVQYHPRFTQFDEPWLVDRNEDDFLCDHVTSAMIEHFIPLGCSFTDDEVMAICEQDKICEM